MRGRGGKRKLTSEQEAQLVALYTDSRVPVDALANTFGVSRRTVYNVVARASADESAPETSNVCGGLATGRPIDSDSTPEAAGSGAPTKETTL